MNKYIDQPMRRYLEDLAGKLDAPGGGSACGLVGAVAAGLGSMVCEFTLGKKKYADVEEEIKDLLGEFTKLRGEFTDLMQQDVDVFHSQMGAAYSLPKETPTEQEVRKRAIEEACKASCQPPFQITRNCFYLLELLLQLADIGTSQLISDVGVAGALAYGALEGARYNININLKYITDESYVHQVLTEIDPMLGKADALRVRITEIVHEKVGRS
jgi:methenyltetrahydrofolate cyclohydrolase